MIDIGLINALSIAQTKQMGNFIKTIKRSNAFKVRNAEYRPWGLKDVIETYGGRPYAEVVEEYRKKREEKKR